MVDDIKAQNAHCLASLYLQVVEPETGRQLLREAEPYDDKKVRCHKNYKGKKVCVATCYKKHCHKCASCATHL